MSLSADSLQSSMLALFVLIAPALVADQLVAALAGASDVHAEVATKASSADLPSFVLPEVVVTADRLGPLLLPEVVVVAERLEPIWLPEVVVVADRLAPDARLAQADTLQRGRQLEIAANAAVLGGVLGANETIQP